MHEYLKALPKAELHLHIEGSLEPELMFALAKRNKIELKYKSVQEIKSAYQFNNLQSFLDIYYAGAGVLIEEQDFYDLAMAYFKKCQEDNVTHAELFFDPQTHTDRGVAFGTVISGLHRAMKDAKSQFQISSLLIMCFLRHLPEEMALETLKQATPYLDKIVAVGLDSSEVGHPPEKFERVFAKARELGLMTVAHAGEEGPPDYIWQALNLLKVKRVDHGVRCLEDSELVAHLRKESVPLTVCPLSNVKLCVFPDLTKHNLKKLLDEGLNVSINSDDPAYFGGYMLQNYEETQIALGLGVGDMATIAKNSFRSSFLSEGEKEVWEAKIDTLASRYLKL